MTNTLQSVQLDTATLSKPRGSLVEKYQQFDTDGFQIRPRVKYLDHIKKRYQKLMNQTSKKPKLDGPLAILESSFFSHCMETLSGAFATN
jgi:hypothetical protein